MSRRVVILTAVTLEAKAIAAACGLATPRPGKPVRSDGAGPVVEIHLIGIRAVSMPADFGAPPPDCIIMAGLAGALDPALQVGDVVIDDCPPPLLPQAAFRAGKIIATNELISTPEEKRSLFENTGALAVDMESAIVRARAATMNVPFISVRAISDAADESLDPAMLGMIDSFGNPRPIHLAGTILRKPAIVPGLIRLGRSSGLAAKNLGTVLSAIVRQFSAGPGAPSK